MHSMTEFQASADFIRSRYPHPVSVVLVLGSGLGDLADTMTNRVKIPFNEIPHFPPVTVAGHSGALCLGEFRPGVYTACLQGRFHYYEGHAMETVVYPMRVLRLLEAQTLIVTNAVGGVNPDFNAGDLMLIDDHINLMGNNPLIGKNLDGFGPRFPDMSEAYTLRLRELALKKAAELGIPLRRGVYCAMTGPSYETPAEIRMVRTLGGDAVGMSTVPEVIVANQMGMQVLGLSCVTNPAAGVKPDHRLNHEEVLEAAATARENFARLIMAVIHDLPVSTPPSAQPSGSTA